MVLEGEDLKSDYAHSSSVSDVHVLPCVYYKSNYSEQLEKLTFLSSSFFLFKKSRLYCLSVMRKSDAQRKSKIKLIPPSLSRPLPSYYAVYHRSLNCSVFLIVLHFFQCTNKIRKRRFSSKFSFPIR